MAPARGAFRRLSAELAACDAAYAPAVVVVVSDLPELAFPEMAPAELTPAELTPAVRRGAVRPVRRAAVRPAQPALRPALTAAA